MKLIKLLLKKEVSTFNKIKEHDTKIVVKLVQDLQSNHNN